MRQQGGLITAEDLRKYEPAIRAPLRGTYRGREILTMPPPSSGGAVLLQMLNILENYDVARLGHNSADSLHLLTEVMRRGFADRAAYMADTDFVKVPIAGMIRKDYAKARAKTIDLKKATPSTKIREGAPPGYESPDTTHFTVIDREGNVVSNTYTLNDSYGSGVTARGTGVLLNNEMDDFTSKPGVPNSYGLVQSEANAIQPSKRPLSAMTPTIVLEDGKLLLTVGSPGGGSIINTVLQVIVNVVDLGMTAQEAVDAPRFHHQWLPDHIAWEAGGLNADTRSLLENRGFIFKSVPGYSVGEKFIGDAQVIMIEKETGMLLGAADPRRGGVALGY
jgi:gamma-glutamyltranspeptidase/glutathione hydrolase